MATAQDLLRLKQKVNELRVAADRAAGAYEQAVSQLEKEWGCSSVEAARKKLNRLKAEETTAADEFEAAYAGFQERWGKQLEERK